MKIDILGTTYQIEHHNAGDDLKLEDANGYCELYSKKLIIEDIPDHPMNFEDLEKFKKHVVRHEIIHAFLHESGLANNSWANDEELVDWIALQFPKLLNAFERADCLD